MSTTNRDAALAARKKFIGGTDIAAIVGLSKWATPLSVYLDKIGEAHPQEETLAMRRGRHMEDFIAAEFERERPGMRVGPGAIVTRHDWGFPAGASLDGRVFGSHEMDEPIAVFEAKTASAFRAREWDEASGDLPDAYYAQVQWYLAVTELPLAYVAADVGDTKRLRIVFVESHAATISKLVQAGRDFWVNHVSQRVPPQPTGAERDSELLTEMYPLSAADSVIDLPESAEEIAAEVVRAAQQEKQAAERKTEAQNRLKALLKDAEAGVIGRYRISWKTQTRTTLDTKRLRVDHPSIAAEFERTSTSRVFRIAEVTE